MKNFTQKKRLANIIIWAAAIPFFFLYWGLSSFADTYGKKITVTYISMLLCAALLCWAIVYSLFLKRENTDKRLPWESWFLYSGLWFIFFALNLTGVFVLFQLQKTFVCGIFIALGLACLFARLVFNFISKTEFFNTTEENIALFIALLLAAFTIAAYFQPSFIAEFFAILFMGCISVLLMALMIKKFVVEQIKFISLQSILDFIFLFLATIATSVATIYFIFWKPGAESQDLFNAVMGIFAGLVGGALTLAGVAWTIRSEREKDRLEEKKKYKPLAIYFKGSKRINYTITLNEYDENRFVSLQKNDKNRCARIIKDFMLRNLDLNDFFVEGLIFNASSKLLRYANLYIEKNKIILFSFQDTMLYFAQPIKKIGVLVKDLLNNEYILELGFENEIQAPEKICIHITGSKGIIEYKENEGKQNG